MKFPDWMPVYGNRNFRGDCPKEDAELATFFNQLRKTYPEVARRAWHTENEGKKHFAQAASSKLKGELSGVSDIVIAGTPTFICEMKRRDHTKSSWQAGQIPFLSSCHEAGCFVCVALSWEGAMEAVFDYLEECK